MKTFKQLVEYISANTEDRLLKDLRKQFNCKSKPEDIEDYLDTLHFTNHLSSKDLEEIVDDFFKKFDCK